jgi:predicted component of type VI protein secretion system
MALLTLKFKELVIKDFPLTGDSRTVGREPSNDIVVENLLVSSYHARIDPAGKDYILTDLQSKNGTIVNGERVTSAKLKNGDQILIGKHLLVFSHDLAEMEDVHRPREETVFVEVAQSGAESSGFGPEVESIASTAVSAERLGVLSFLSGGREEYAISKKLVKLGKGDEADIHIGGLLTPKVAATISRRATGYYLTPVGRAKVKVNDAQIKGSLRLKEFDSIEVGSVRLQFYYRD